MFIKSIIPMHNNVCKYRIINDDFKTIMNKSWVDKNDNDNSMNRFDNDNELIMYSNFETIEQLKQHEIDFQLNELHTRECDLIIYDYVNDETI